jgi:uncharacterized membrane protein YeaQ/YmgE (transglycosylase-associated protein family)
MFHMIGHMIFGLIVGVLAKLLFPGHDPGGIIVTILLGIAGAWVGGFLGRALGLYPPGHPAGFGMALVGAVVLLLIYHMAAGDRGTRRAEVPPGTAVVALLVNRA